MVFFIPAGGKGLICGAGSARSRRGRHTLRCRCIPARCGRRPTLSSPPLSARAQAHAVLPKAVEAGTDGRATALRRRSGPTTRSLRWRSSSKGDLICAAFLLRPFRCGPTFFSAVGVSFFYDSFCSFELHLSLHFSFWPCELSNQVQHLIMIDLVRCPVA